MFLTIFRIVFLTATVAATVNAEFNLNIKMDYFINENVHSSPTYFRFCLTTSNTASECIGLFQTQTIGENTISTDQFKLTTDTIQIKFDNDLTSAEHKSTLNLFVQAFNSENNQLLSSWTLELTNSAKFKWNAFKQNNATLGQRISFLYKIECSEKFYGSSCEIPICSIGCDQAKGGFCDKPGQCLCKPGWTGSNCDELIIESINKSALASSHGELVCKNGGVCVHDSATNRSSCKCDWSLFKGERCEIRILHTCKDTSVCLNGGSCYANGECLCAPGYAGDRCQIKRLTSQCGLFTCYNGGTCFIDNQNEYACVCHSAFTGKNCNIKTTTTTTSTTMTTTTTTTTTQTAETTPLVSSAIQFSILTEIVRIESSTNKPLLVADESDKFTIEQIVLIVLIGVGLPVFLILLAIVVFRLCASRQASMKAGEFVVQKGLSDDVQKLNKKKENIYVSCSNLNQAATIDMTSHNSQENERYMASIDLKTTQDNVYCDNYSSISGLDFQFATKQSPVSSYNHNSTSSNSTYLSSNIYSVQYNSPKNQGVMISIV